MCVLCQFSYHILYVPGQAFSWRSSFKNASKKLTPCNVWKSKLSSTFLLSDSSSPHTWGLPPLLCLSWNLSPTAHCLLQTHSSLPVSLITIQPTQLACFLTITACSCILFVLPHIKVGVTDSKPKQIFLANLTNISSRSTRCPFCMCAGSVNGKQTRWPATPPQNTISYIFLLRHDLHTPSQFWIAIPGFYSVTIPFRQ